MFAIIRTDGKQYRVAQGETIRFARISAEPGDAFETDQVLAIGGEEMELKFGKPLIVGAKVKGTILQHGKDQKVIVFKRKRRKTYRRKYGHRQAHTLVKIDKVSAKAPVPKKAVPEKNTEEKVTVNKAPSKKAVPVKTTPKKTASVKAPAEKAVHVKATPKKAAPKKAAPKKAAPLKTTSKKTAPLKPTPKKATDK